MANYSKTEAGYKHASEVFAKRILRFMPTRTLAGLLYDPQGAEAIFNRHKNLGDITECFDNSFVGSGVPALATVPNGGAVGNYYFRTDTPGTVNQRIYVCTVAGTSAAIGTWVATAA